MINWDEFPFNLNNTYTFCGKLMANNKSSDSLQSCFFQKIRRGKGKKAKMKKAKEKKKEEEEEEEGKEKKKQKEGKKKK